MGSAVHKHLIFVWLTLLSLALAYLAVGQARPAPTPAVPRIADFEQINVQRLNVVEADGKPRVIISNRTLFPGIYWGGKEFKHHDRDTGGFLFFNREGDEVGGMTFDAVRQGDGFSASSGLMFDQYQQDQTVGLVYDDRNGQRTAGLRIWDRPSQSTLPLLELSDQAARASDDAAREAIRKQMLDLVKSWGPMGERAFVGKMRDDSLVRLADKQGRPRLVLKVDGAGEPSVEFLDEAGKVTRRIPEK